jgi:excisionase family DNA binding protein
MSGLAQAFLAELGPDDLAELAGRLAPYLTAAPVGPEYLTVQEAAEYLRCKPKRVYDLVSQRRLAPRRDGSRLLFLRSDLDAYRAGGDHGFAA